MALSGSFGKDVGSYWRLQGEWSATQNISANTSTITLKTYWMATSSYGSTSSSATKSGTSTIEGTEDSFSGAGLASLSGNQKKLINTQTKTVTHASDGTFTDLDLAISFNVALTLGGTYYGTVSASTSVSLNTIPRTSKLNDTTPTWTAGGDITFGITRYSTSFYHEIEIYLADSAGTSEMPDGTKATHLKQLVLSSSETSKSSAFTTAEKLETFQRIKQGSSVKAWIRLQTFTNSARTSQVGSTQEYYGTVSAPSASTTSSSMNFNIGSAVTIGVSRADGEFVHTLRFYVGSTLIHTSPARSVGTSYTWTPTTTEINNMYNATQTVNSISSKVEIDTFYVNGTSYSEVRTGFSKTGTATVTNSNPTFGSGYTYADTNTKTIALTSDATKIIQNKSTVQVTIPATAKATAKNGATIKRYEATINGVMKTVNHSETADMVFPTTWVINSPTNLSLTIKAIDSRGNSATTSKTITMIPYSIPTANATAKRKNSFEEDTTLALNGSISQLVIGTTPKNSIKSVSYRYKESKATGAIPTWDTWTSFLYQTSGATYTATPVIIPMDNTKTFTVEYKIEDQLEGVTLKTLTVAQGTPILFVDSKLKSVGVGKFPTGTGTFETANSVIAKDIKLTDGTNTTTALTMQTGDANGHGVMLGWGGRTVIGGGEGGQTFIANDSSSGGTENIYLASDGNVWMMAGLQDWASRYGWTFRSDGAFNFPNANSQYLDQYGNVKGWASTLSSTWNVIDSSGTTQIQVPMGKNNSAQQPIKVGQFQMVSNLGETTDPTSSSALVFRQYSSTNYEYILMSDATNGFYFNADQDLPAPGNVGTGNGQLFASKYNVVSDENMKENIVECEISALDKVKEAQTYEYDHIMSDERRAKLEELGIEPKKSLGLIAQQAPEEITTEEGTGIDLYAMNTMLWKAVQELSAEVDALKSQLTAQ